MAKKRTGLAAALLATGFTGVMAGAAGSAGAAVPTCLGQRATIVVEGATATDVRTRWGSGGDDVIVLVKNPAIPDDVETVGGEVRPAQYWKVQAGGGDDLVCLGADQNPLTNSPRAGVELDAGLGADTVFVSHQIAESGLQLNHGDDVIYLPTPVAGHLLRSLDRLAVHGGTGGKDHVTWQTAGYCGVTVVATPGGLDGLGNTARSGGGCAANAAVRFLVDGFETLTGSVNRDHIETGAGRQTINGLQGDDTLVGGAGRDTIRGGDGHDTIAGGGHGDELRGGKGDDTVTGGPGRDNLYGGAGDDDLRGGTGEDSADGRSGADRCRAEHVTACER